MCSYYAKLKNAVMKLIFSNVYFDCGTAASGIKWGLKPVC